MASYVIRIVTDNDMFSADDAGTETARILRQLADSIDGLYISDRTLMDRNGNTVGSAVVSRSSRRI